MTTLASAIENLGAVLPMEVTGSVAALRGLTVLVDELAVPVGSLVRIGPASAGRMGEVVGFTQQQAIVMPLGQTAGVRPGERVVALQASPTIAVSDEMLGRVVNGLGKPIDGKGAIRGAFVPRRINPDPIGPMTRARIKSRLTLGLRAVDLMTPIGRGQRMGIFAGPGVGKSTLLASMVKDSDADVAVVALIGERGREVKDFIEHSLGEEGMKRAVVVAATGDESALMRIRAAKAACSIAEHFRDKGLSVLLVMDSATRFAHAQRQVGLSVGEPPATKGYTPSVFAELARLLERAGSVLGGGSITGLYTILVEGDDMTEPVADACRGILDGHLMLSRKLAQKAHFPAIDVLDSVSRVADDISEKDHTLARQRASRLLALYREVEDLVQIGAYAKGSSPEHDVAIEVQSAITAIMRQGRGESTPFEKAKSDLVSITSASFEQIERTRRKK